jgi:hypothetical protein
VHSRDDLRTFPVLEPEFGNSGKGLPAKRGAIYGFPQAAVLARQAKFSSKAKAKDGLANGSTEKKLT